MAKGVGLTCGWQLGRLYEQNEIESTSFVTDEPTKLPQNEKVGLTNDCYLGI